MKMYQCLGTYLSSLPWWFLTCVLFILCNAFFPQSIETNIEISGENKTKPLRPHWKNKKKTFVNLVFILLGKKLSIKEAWKIHLISWKCRLSKWQNTQKYKDKLGKSICNMWQMVNFLILPRILRGKKPKNLIEK